MGFCLDKALLGAAGAALATGIDKLAQMIKTSIETARAPANSLPPLLTSIEAMCRPGLSAIALTSSIVSRLGEAGVDTGTLPDGSEPQITKAIRIAVEETIKEFQLNGKVTVEMPPGINVGMAGNIPVITVTPVSFSGIYQ